MQKHEDWSVRHWARPYNYPLFTFYIRILMLVSLPLFYDVQYAQISILIILQLFEVVRLLVVWPYAQRWRNLFKLGLDAILLMFFSTVMAQSFYVSTIQLNNSELNSAIDSFYQVGWVGFLCIFAYNIAYFLLLAYDLYVSCQKTNRELMDEARRAYYYAQLSHHEESRGGVGVALMNRWVKLGNLNQRNYDVLPDINLRIELFRICRQRDHYEIEVKKFTRLFLNLEFNYSGDNNIDTQHHLQKKIRLTPKLSEELFALVDHLYKQYKTPSVEYVVLKTFQQIAQSQYSAGDEIPMEKEKMKQRVALENHNGTIVAQEIEGLLKGFPIEPRLLESL